MGLYTPQANFDAIKPYWRNAVRPRDQRALPAIVVPKSDLCFHARYRFPQHGWSSAFGISTSTHERSVYARAAPRLTPPTVRTDVIRSGRTGRPADLFLGIPYGVRRRPVGRGVVPRLVPTARVLPSPFEPSTKRNDFTRPATKNGEFVPTARDNMIHDVLRHTT